MLKTYAAVMDETEYGMAQTSCLMDKIRFKPFTWAPAAFKSPVNA